MDYKEKLKDKRWIELSKKVKELYDNRCCGCGGSKNLNTHHIKYIKGREPWEYDTIELTVLCKDCHNTFHNNEKRLKEILGNNILYYQYEFEQIIEMLELIIKIDSFKYLVIIAYLETLNKDTF